MANEVEIKKICKPVFGITYTRYMQLAHDEIVPLPTIGKVDIIAAAKALIEYYRQLAISHGNLSLTDEKRALTAIKKEREKLKLEQERGNLIARNVQVEWLTRCVSEAQIGFRGLPRRLAASIALKSDEREIELELRAEITRILRELAANKQGRRKK